MCFSFVDVYLFRVIPVNGRFHTYSVLEPIGVCAQIIPWNSPLPQAGQKLAPALAANNA